MINLPLQNKEQYMYSLKRTFELTQYNQDNATFTHFLPVWTLTLVPPALTTVEVPCPASVVTCISKN